MTRAGFAEMMYYLCIIFLVVGVFLEFGIGWALMTLGVTGGLSFLLVFDADGNSE